MTNVEKVLRAFDALTPEGRQEVAAEIFCRLTGLDLRTMSEADMEELAGELFGPEDDKLDA